MDVGLSGFRIPTMVGMHTWRFTGSYKAPLRAL